MRRRFLILGLSIGLLLAAAPGTSLAAAGCREFSEGVVDLVQAQHPFGQFIKAFVPVNDEVAVLKGVFCAGED